MDHTESAQTECVGNQLSSVSPTGVILPSAEENSNEVEGKSSDNRPNTDDDGTGWNDDEFEFEIDPHDLFKHFHHLPDWDEFFQRWCESGSHHKYRYQCF